MNHLNRLGTFLPSAFFLTLIASMAGCGGTKNPEKEAAAKENNAPNASAADAPPDMSKSVTFGRFAAHHERSLAVDLLIARKNFKSQFRVKGPAPQIFQNERPPEGAKEVTYESGELKLKGWLGTGRQNEKGEKAEKKKPAVVFLHGGFAFSKDDWKDAEPFLKAGYVLFMPTLRGENGNPGFYESFLGEVDDAVAAGRFVASLPEVDPQRIFIAGHSSGAVLTCLVSMVPTVYKAAATFDGYLDMESWALGSDPALVPYDPKQSEEIFVRNPQSFVESVRCPLRLYASPAGARANQPFANRAKHLGKKYELVIVPGDHQSMVAPAIQLAIAWFQEVQDVATPSK